MSSVDRMMTLTEDRELIPIADVVTGRGFITGKSGSGKSNTASVLCEELLDEGIPLMIVDTDGEYYGLKEEYELLHVGGDERCDLRIGPQHAEKIAEITLESNVPIILDVSGFIEESDSKRLVHDVVRELFVKEKKAKVPYLLLIEEAHEFIPESGGLDEVGDMLVRVAKRGRKRGLGVCAMSQRPASVSKDFITQCDWIVWHRLTWKNDTQVVSRIMGSQTADEVQNLEPGEAVMLADWEDEKVRVKFRKKHTLDAGATPDLDGLHEDPETNNVRSDIVDELEDAGASLTKQGEEKEWNSEDEAAATAGAVDAVTDNAGHRNDDGDGSASNGAATTQTSTEEDLTGRDVSGSVRDSPDSKSSEEPDESTPSRSNHQKRDDSGVDGGEPSNSRDEDGTSETTEDALERAAKNVSAGSSSNRSDDGQSSRSRGNSASADGGVSHRTRRPDPDRSDDVVWEIAELVAYLVGSIGAAAHQIGASVARAIRRPFRAGDDRNSHPGNTKSTDTFGRPAVGLIVAVMLLLIGLVVGIAIAQMLL